jgi:hypothetical protein
MVKRVIDERKWRERVKRVKTPSEATSAETRVEVEANKARSSRGVQAERVTRTADGSKLVVGHVQHREVHSVTHVDNTRQRVRVQVCD